MISQFDLDRVYHGKKVLITGHTGFKGSWLSLWLMSMGAEVHGYALSPPTTPALFDQFNLGSAFEQELADIRDFDQLRKTVDRVKPDIIFHLAAQSLVRRSYDIPRETIEVNAMGTVNLLEAIRQSGVSTSVVLITSDKCYDNKEWLYGYREEDALGGRDPYSASKGVAEILIGSWRNSYFDPVQIKSHGVRVASARAGNVIGGGDWSEDSILPDCIRDLQSEGVIMVRNPYATRPWQHVLEPLSGYLLLGANLMTASAEKAGEFCGPFNFGPGVAGNRPVQELVESVIEHWGKGSWKWVTPEIVRHEASLLGLSIDKAFHKLHWLPQWDFDTMVAKTVEWYRMIMKEPDQALPFSLQQIKQYQLRSLTRSMAITDEIQVQV